jgi:hypothetical protein
MHGVGVHDVGMHDVGGHVVGMYNVGIYCTGVRGIDVPDKGVHKTLRFFSGQRLLFDAI